MLFNVCTTAHVQLDSKNVWILIREGRLNKHRGKKTGTNSPLYQNTSQLQRSS